MCQMHGIGIGEFFLWIQMMTDAVFAISRIIWYCPSPSIVEQVVVCTVISISIYLYYYQPTPGETWWPAPLALPYSPPTAGSTDQVRYLHKVQCTPVIYHPQSIISIRSVKSVWLIWWHWPPALSRWTHRVSWWHGAWLCKHRQCSYHVSINMSH